MSLDPIASAALEFAVQVEGLYTALLGSVGTRPCAEPSPGAEPSLGGKLLYAGELSPHGRPLLVAGNIAGAASLTATADLAAQKQAIRDGVADFLVTTLDEALRILKNEIRKHETVAVCVAASPEAIEREMLERGVLPDLLGPLCSSSSANWDRGIRRIDFAGREGSQVLVTWSVGAAAARWLPKLDALATDCLNRDSSAEAWAARRWLRLAPRFLGRLANGLRILRCQADIARDFVSSVQSAIDRREIGVEVRMRVNNDEEIVLVPPSQRRTP